VLISLGCYMCRSLRQGGSPLARHFLQKSCVLCRLLQKASRNRSMPGQALQVMQLRVSQ
jgi:hypothetical protein